MVSIILALDTSGSMNRMGDEPLSACNAFIEEQKKAHHARGDVAEPVFSLYLFSTTIRQPVVSQPIQKVEMLQEYKASGMTCYFDTMGTIMDKAITEGDSGGFLCIISDGMDTCSKKYSQKDIRNMQIKMAELGWHISIIGAKDIIGEIGNDGHYQYSFDATCPSGELLDAVRQASQQINDDFEF